MSPEEVQYTMQAVYRQFPWASEETVKRLAELSRSNNIKTVALAAGLQKALGNAGADKLAEYIDDAVNIIEDNIRDGADVRKEIQNHGKDLTSAMTSGNTGIEAMTELSYAGAQALDRAASAGAQFASGFGRIGGLANIVSGGTGAAVAATGVGVVFAKLISEQEKQLRAMIDYGLVLSDTAHYTNLRGQLANMAMTMDDLNSILGATSDAIVSLYSDVEIGTTQLLSFLESDTARREAANFGYTPKQTSMLLAEEAAQLTRLNAVNELNDFGQRKILNSFKTVNQVAGYMSETLGVQRDAMLEARRQQREDTTFVLAMAQNFDYIEETFGEGAAENIREAGDFMAMLTSATLGQETSGEIMNIFNSMLADIQIDQSAQNNMLNPEFVKKLQLLGPGVYETMVALIEDAATNKIQEPEEMITRQRELVQLIQESKPMQGVDPSIIAANEMIASANLLPQSFFDLTQEQIKLRLDTTQDIIDGADDSIEIVGGMSRAFLQVQHQLVPGFETMGDVMGLMEKTVGTFTDLWIDIFGIGGNNNADPVTVPSGDNIDEFNDFSPRTFDPASVSSSSGLPSNFTTPTQEAQDQLSEVQQELNDVRQQLANVNGETAQEYVDSLREQSDRLTELRNQTRTALRETREQHDVLVANQEAARQAMLNVPDDAEPGTLSTLTQAFEDATMLVRQKQEEVDTLEEAFNNLARDEQQARREYQLAQRHSERALTEFLESQVEELEAKEELLQSQAQASTPNSDLVAAQMVAALNEFGITDQRAQANVVGMVSGESGFRLVSEQSYRNTSVARIRSVLESRAKYYSDSELESLKQDDEAFFNAMYGEEQANRRRAAGASERLIRGGDLGGYRYRGRGYIQLTGRHNYQRIGDLVGLDLLNNPDLVNDPRYAARIAAAYYGSMSDSSRARLVDAGHAYAVTFGAQASGARLADAQQRARIGQQYLERINNGTLPMIPGNENTVIPAEVTELQGRERELRQQIQSLGNVETGLNTSGEQLTALQIAELVNLEEELEEVTRELVELVDG